MITMTRAGTRGGRPATVACWLAVAPVAAWAPVRLTGQQRGPLVPAIAFTPYVAAVAPVEAVARPPGTAGRATPARRMSQAALAPGTRARSRP
ncbi:hypothetical protein [Micromonospora marina]|uniref:Uncharacterized protein n=1 Tax=Micromonospora marina TaxID=307120 RepID=A0A1C4YRL9_9ACTN|nr:hypothetical protein GA0070215_112100 [Micromonospora marina]